MWVLGSAEEAWAGSEPVVDRQWSTSGSLLRRPYFGSLTVHFGPLLCHTPLCMCMCMYEYVVVHVCKVICSLRFSYGYSNSNSTVLAESGPASQGP